MPQHKDINSLKDACLDNIAVHMESYWWETYGRCSLDTWIHCNDRPFEALPGCLMVDIIERLKEMDCLWKNNLLLLITTKLERLHLPRGCIPGKDVLILISQICKETLQELTIQQFYHQNELMNMLGSLERLEVLNLSRSEVDGEVLSIIGSSCPKIRDLDVSFSNQVTDEGIGYLFDDQLTSNGSRRHGKCKSISRLNLFQTIVSQEGVEAAIHNLPNLRHLDHPYVVKVLSNRQRHLSERTTLCQLSSVFGCYLELDDYLGRHLDALSLALDSCPLITEVHLILNGVRNLDPLCELKNLRVLDLRTCSETDGTFPEMVLPILRACGATLKNLSLRAFIDVDVGDIASNCTNLEVLILYNNRSYNNINSEPSQSVSTPEIFYSRLKMFKYHNAGEALYLNEEIGNTQLKTILSSPLLECITIGKSNSVSDDLLKDVLTGGQKFTNLKELNLKYCHTLTAVFVRTFLKLQGPLRRINILGCRNITKFDKMSFNALIYRNMWSLHLSCIC